MAEYKKLIDESTFAENFAQLKPLMTQTEAHYESSRCLFCYDAPCVNACPTAIDIPLFIRQINNHHETGAARTIYDSNYFGYACGKVCPTEVLCEGACVYNHSDVKPIEIGRLQSYATEKAIRQSLSLHNPVQDIPLSVAIIGAGPAGISCACELRKKGIHVDVFEAKDKPSGLTVYGVAPYKITNEEAVNEVVYLQSQFGFQIQYNHPISSDADFRALEQQYDAIFMGAGLGSTSPISIPGENLPGVIGAVEFIEMLRMKHAQMPVPSRVVVLGGGNTAMDAANESARMGADSVHLVYRRSMEEKGAYHFEYELAKQAGVEGIWNAAPTEIMGDHHVEGIRLVLTEMQNGKLVQIKDSQFELPCDLVILATGQSKQVQLAAQAGGIETDPSGRIMVNTQYQTSIDKYFAAGDIVSGGKEVVNAAAEGKAAAKGIWEWLNAKH